MAIWDILLPFGTFCVHLVHFSGFGILYQEKSGDPGISLLGAKLPTANLPPEQVAFYANQGSANNVRFSPFYRDSNLGI
jgi:hypothetical protein